MRNKKHVPNQTLDWTFEILVFSSALLNGLGPDEEDRVYWIENNTF